MGNLIHGFRIVSKTALDEMQAEGFFARHEATGLELYHIHNDDTENLFAFAFMTTPHDSSGVAHIVEHSVLCGSKNYPLADPFLALAKQSVKTFLNAITFPDKTVYPASSIIEADYFNLMSVYGDAVFFPLLKRETFEQEGYRLARDKNGQRQFSGVVLNEMRGVYADFDSGIDRWSRWSVMQDSIYAHDSGGAPLDIVKLSYEDFCAFHKKYYHPVNAKVFLYGNIETEKQLAFLQERFLQFFSSAEKPPLIPALTSYSEPRFFSVQAPAGEGKNLNKIAMTVNWLLPESADIDRLMDAMLLEEVLIGHDGAPLQKRLFECDFAEDVYPYNGGQSELKNICFTIGLTDVDKTSEKLFTSFILSSLEQIVQEGIDRKVIDTALNTLDFANREIIRAGGPFSLILMRRALRGWIHGNHPDSSLRFIPAFERLKQRVAEHPRYAEQLIRTLLLENRHRAVVAVHPDLQFCAKLDAALARYGQAQEDVQDGKEAALPMPDGDDAYKLIPHILKEDLPPAEDSIPEYLEYLGDVPVVFHEQPTNGISYLDLAIPVDSLSSEDYRYLTLYTAAFSSMGTETEGWDSVAADFAYLTGGFSAVTFAAGDARNREPAVFFDNAVNADDLVNRDWVLIRSKMLPEYIEPAVNRIFSYLHTLSFKDERRLQDIFVQLKNDLDSLPAAAGHSLTALHAGAAYAGVKRAENLWIGFPQLRFMREQYQYMQGGGAAIREISRRLTDIHRKLLSAGMLCKVCGTATDIARMKKALAPHVQQFCYPHRSAARFRSAAFEKPAPLSAFPGAVAVGFAGMVLPLAFSENDYGSRIVYARWLQTGMLWKAIRERGGAYGVDAHGDPAASIFTITSYRDPTPLKSLCSIRSIIETSCSEALSASELDALITGTYSTVLQPRTPAQRSSAAFSRLLNGITREARLGTIAGILSCTLQAIRCSAEQLAAAIPESSAALIGSEAALRLDAEDARKLPPLTVLDPI